jgi:uncharacterized membrane protein/pimeloyl-ACP methyl ester carboxylesterase/uncharacterized membrane protein YbhN (UPF0104 family)
MQNKTIKLLKYLLGWPISLISLVFIFRIILIKSSSIVTYVRNLKVEFIIIGLFFFLIYYFTRGFLWQKMLSLKGYSFRLKEITYLWEITEFKRYVPGNIWSFVSRGLSMSKRGVEKKDIVDIFLLEIKLIILSCLIFSIFAMAWLFDLLPKSIHDLNLEIVANIFIILLTVGFLFSKKISSRLKFLSFPLDNLAFTTNLKLLLVSIFSFLCFGIGSYFVAISVTPLPLSHIIVFSALFVFALLIGYLSFVTPMGLGVREGIVIWFLLPILRLNLAAAVSVVTRVFLIISELIFLSIIYIWNNWKNKWFLKLESFISKYRYETGLAFLILSYLIYFTVATFLRFNNFYTGRFDLGNMDQVVWNTIHGRIFQLTDPNGTDIVSRIIFHSDFLLILLSPFYLIWSNPKMLLLIQTFVLGLGAIFIYSLSINIVKNKKIALLLSFAFLIYPPLQYANLYDFHAVTLATTFLLGTFYFIRQKKYLWFLIFAVLSALTKENIWLATLIFGLYLIFLNTKNKIKQKKPLIIGIVLSAISIIVFYGLIFIAIPKIRGSEHFALSYYSDFGDSPGGIIKNIIFSPLKTISIFLEPKRLSYLYQLFSSVGFLSIFSLPYLVFAIPDLLINILSNNSQLHQIYYQYTAAITPFVFISAIYGIAFLKKRFYCLSYNLVFYYLLCTTLASAYFIGPLPGSAHPNIDMFIKPLENRKAISEFIDKIPAPYSIASTNNLGAHMSHRQRIYTIPVGINQADIVLFLLNDPFAQPSLFTQKEMAKNMEKDSKYVQVFKNGDFVAFEKKNLFITKNPRTNPNKLFPYAIEALGNRGYKESKINIEAKININRSVISYDSDGLKIYATMSIPSTQKPNKGFPVLILNHGYINPAAYNNVTDYAQIEEYFANTGFLVIKPDYRGNGKSDGAGEPLNRFAYPIDVLNLIASLKNVSQADANRIYIWGHSMGGEVSLQTVEAAEKVPNIKGKIKAVDLWAPVTDPVKWFTKSHLGQLPEAQLTPFPYNQTFGIMGEPRENSLIWQSVSPLRYLSIINIPVLLQHGTADQTVPYEWSIELSNNLNKLSKKSNLITYSNNDHNLSLSHSTALNDSASFFNQY